MTVLARIGGEGYSRAINRTITSPGVYASSEALLLAHKRPNTETYQLLKQVALQEGEGNRCINDRANAVLALARCGQWPAFILGVMKCGFLCHAEIGHSPLVATPLDNISMAPALESLAGGAPTVGAILAIGLGQQKDQIDALCDLLERTTDNLETAQACIQAIGYLGDCGKRAVQLIGKQLYIAANYHSAWISLLRIGSDEAIDILVNYTQQTYDQNIAINLLYDSRVKTEVARLVRDHFIKQTGVERPTGRREFEKLLAYFDDGMLAAYLLGDDKIQDQVRHSATASEGMIWYIGAKAAVIKALSAVSKQEAYEIALTALHNPDSRDRERYPSILVQLDEEQATANLFDQIKLEKNSAVRRSIGSALSQF